MNDVDRSTSKQRRQLPPVQRWAAVFWPSFIFAGITITLFFTAVDPQALLDCSGSQPVDRITAYSLGFLICWVFYSGCSAATAYLVGTHIPPRKRTETDDDIQP